MKKITFVVSAVLLVSVIMTCSSNLLEAQTGSVAATSDSTVDFRKIVQQANSKVFPAVVYIRCLSESMESGKKITQEVSGSGVLISADGEVLTNWHVIDKAVEIRCLLLDGIAFDAEIVGKDKDTDLALLQLQLKKDTPPLKFAKLGDSTKLKEGDFVMAMGAPWGLNRSVSIGIISCTSRYLPTNSEYSLWLQTDAAISPGNSGGPLVNTAGEIVGINTRGIMRGGDMGFAIPSETAKLITARLKEFKKVNWSWTGIQLQPLKDFNKNMYFEGTEGVFVAETDPESPARKAGLLPRDRIMKINGAAVRGEWAEDLPAIRKMLGLLPKDIVAKLEIKRGDKTLTIEITPRTKGKVEGDELDCPRWDMTIKTINQFDNPDLYYHRTEGVFIFGIKYPGNASASDLNEQDIILKINGKKVKTLDDVKKIHAEAIKNVDKKHRILFVVLRSGLMRQVMLDFARDHEKE
ncbi:MAG: trypsin-like peptidase domain-containing protein [Phycisphaerae bacterium]|nr:trypsin-like peptidase domain-containing protein [Phycisphaerae bacterium]